MDEAGRSLSVVRRIVTALDRRDVPAVTGSLATDAVVVVGGRTMQGREAVGTWVDGLLGLTAASRLQVEESTALGRQVTDRFVLGVLPPGEDRGWVVASGVVAWSVGGDGLVHRADVSVDEAALGAQWSVAGGAPARLTAGSIRSDLARAGFDAAAEARTVVKVVTVPPPPRHGPGGRAVTVGLLVAALAVGGVYVAGDQILPGDRPAGVAAEDAADGAAGTGGAVPGSEVATPTAGAGRTPTGPAPAADPSAGTAPAPSGPATTAVGEGPVLGPAAVAEEDGTERLVLSETVLFPSGSSRLRPEAVEVLGAVVADLRRAGGGEVRVVGHTDSRGTPAGNDALSQARADAVASVLRSGLGGSPVVVVAEGRGQQDPVASNDTEDGRAANRRVDLEYRGG